MNRWREREIKRRVGEAPPIWCPLLGEPGEFGLKLRARFGLHNGAHYTSHSFPLQQWVLANRLAGTHEFVASPRRWWSGHLFAPWRYPGSTATATASGSSKGGSSWTHWALSLGVLVCFAAKLSLHRKPHLWPRLHQRRCRLPACLPTRQHASPPRWPTANRFRPTISRHQKPDTNFSDRAIVVCWLEWAIMTVPVIMARGQL